MAVPAYHHACRKGTAGYHRGRGGKFAIKIQRPNCVQFPAAGADNKSEVKAMDEWKRHNQGTGPRGKGIFFRWALPAAVLAAAFLIAASPAKAVEGETKASMDLDRVADDTKFENALQFYNLRDEHRALQEFHEYLEIYLNGAHRNEAYRHIARIHFDRFEYDKSVRAYSAIYEDSTGTEEGVEAYYRAAICYQKMGDGFRAHRIYQSIIEQYPYSNFAYLSKIQMDLMKIIAGK